MTGTEWFLLIVVVILIPLVIAVGVTLWTLEMARQRNRRNRPGGKQPGVARKASRPDDSDSNDGIGSSGTSAGIARSDKADRPADPD